MIHIYSKPLVTLFLLLLVTTVFSQNFELGKVTLEELQEKVHPIDSSASAAVLFETGDVKIIYSKEKGFVLNKTVKIRMKIYKKSGYDFANKFILFRPDEKIYISNAKTYNLVAGKIEKTKLTSEGEFDEKVNKYLNRKKITMPNVKEGSVIEFEYLLETENIGNISDWEFQSRVPVNYSEYKMYIPEYFVYKPHYKGYLIPETTVSRNQKNIVFKIGGGSIRNGVTIYQIPTDYESFIYQETATTYKIKNAPALKKESHVNNLNNYISSVSHELSVVNYPNSSAKKFNTDWESVVKTIYGFDDFGGELDKSGYFEEDIKPIISGLSTSEEKIAAILAFVKSKVKWNGYYGYWCNDGVKKAYKDNVGNVGEINLMLTSMLRYAGLKANPVLVSTRANGITFLPNISAYDYVIAAVELDNAIVLLDATDKNSFFNVLPTRDLNWFGQLIREDATSLHIALMPNTNSKDNVTILATIDQEGAVKGQIRRQLTDYNAFVYRDTYATITNETLVEKVENSKGGIDIENLTIENKDDLIKPIVENYTFTDNKHSEVINDKIYFSPLLFDVLTENPFKQEKREYPIDFNFPFTDKYMINYQIPAGYEVESMPLPVNMQFGDNIGSFKFNINKADDKIQVVVQFGINTSIVSAEYYEDIKLFYQKMIEKQNEKIVLKRI